MEDRRGGECVPLYEYRCQNCGQKFEKLVRISSRDQEVTCPSCGSCRSQRAISLFATSSGSTAGSGMASTCAPAAGGG